ncbi:MAG: IS1595 family transposase [Hyphomonadaceae bacterium JAD_PAG50586_4]|nr:MAG: IS1595 family transposase [Hyphomonadaceae bacterium JAD_PAG50586_4]
MKFDAPQFQSEAEARRYIEALRWPGGRVCPKCGVIGAEYETKREGRYRCGAKECRKDFTVMTGTVMEASHIKLTVWLMAFYLMASSKKGMSAHQLHRSLDVTYKSAWFLAHRIRAAMASGGLTSPMGGSGQIVEADETYYGKVENPRTQRFDGKPYKPGKKQTGPANKRAVVALIERGGQARVFHVAEATRETVEKIVKENVDPKSRLHTDESKLYPRVGAEFASHETVKHTANEYARGDVHVNTAEGFFGVFKKGMTGVYQHCSEKHLHRYLSEYEFRFNNRTKLGVTDVQRAQRAIEGADGKRLTYRRTNGQAAS